MDQFDASNHLTLVLFIIIIVQMLIIVFMATKQGKQLDKDMLELFVTGLGYIAKSTPNTLDDKAVSALESIIDNNTAGITPGKETVSDEIN